MLRRVHMPLLAVGRLSLTAAQAHHVRDVLRLNLKDQVELFDAAGTAAVGTIVRCDDQVVEVNVDALQPAQLAPELIVASAVPKGERADWMVEKLGELGVTAFIPLITARSVVVPSGANKLDRWRRIAAESAQQSRRAGVMKIGELCELGQAVTNATDTAAIYLSTLPGAQSMLNVCSVPRASGISLFIGPEGGWTDDEIARFADHNLTPARLTATILRVETAAVAAAAVAATLRIAEAANP